MSDAWKDHERQVARKLNGTRNKRGADFSQSMGDVEHEVFSIECKYRASIGKLVKDALKQASEYDKTKVPIAILKEKNMRGEVAVLWLDDLIKLLEGEHAES